MPSKFVGDADEANAIAVYLQKQKQQPAKPKSEVIQMSQPSQSDLTFYQRIKRMLRG